MKLLLTLLFVLLSSGCEILEEDISHKKVPIIAPADHVTVASGAVDFRWSKTAYTAGFELMVVSPTFAAAARVIADTVMWTDTLAHSFGCRLILDEGAYQWQVKGFNGSYETRAEIRSLTVLPDEMHEP